MRLLPHKDPLACREVVELVTDYLEGSLPRGERRRFEAHLADCPHCTEYLAQMRATIRLTGRLEPDDLSAAMRDDLGELYRRWRDDEKGS
jgi:anti-sigma factor RsiW